MKQNENLKSILKPPAKAQSSDFAVRLRRDKLRWIDEPNPRNWGPALKEWGLSVAKK